MSGGSEGSNTNVDVRPCLKGLFLEWLQDLRRESMKSNSHASYAYSKAIRALQAYPLPVRSARETLQFQGIGPKTADRLKTLLVRHYKEKGVAVPVTPEPSAKDKAKAKTTKKRVSKPRAYIPKPESGPYALLVTLLKYSDRPGYNTHMTKQELQTLAQPICKESFTIPTGAGSHYTAWNSMSTLVKKNLVVKNSCPAKYSLTVDGKDLAERLLAASGSDSQPGSGSAKSTGGLEALGQLQTVTVGSKSMAPPSGTSPARDEADGTDVCENCEVSTSTVVCIECNEAYCDPCKAFLHQSKKKKNHSFQKIPVKSSTPIAMDEDVVVLDDTPPSSPEVAMLPLAERIGWNKRKGGDSRRSPRLAAKRRKQDSDSLSLKEVPKPPAFRPRVSGHQQSFSLRPDEYDIVLVIDAMEQTGNRRNKGVFHEKLTSYGLKCETRKVALGDFLWIAKERVKPVPGQLHLPSSRELLLDFVVERKRLDDLASSIVDHRFHEQKFRFKSMKVKKPVYLVEHYGSIDSQRLAPAVLQQALADTQMEGFFVKETKSLSETVEYLVLLSRHLSETLAGKTLRCGAGDETNSQDDDGAMLFRSFPDFNDQATKSQDLSVKEMLVKQLIQVSQLTTKRALEIVKSYPTPSALMEALGEASDGDNLFSTMTSGGVKSFGPALSKRIAELYS